MTRGRPHKESVRSLKRNVDRVYSALHIVRRFRKEYVDVETAFFAFSAILIWRRLVPSCLLMAPATRAPLVVVDD